MARSCSHNEHSISHSAVHCSLVTFYRSDSLRTNATTVTANAAINPTLKDKEQTIQKRNSLGCFRLLIGNWFYGAL